jgi:hypothetical protein
VLRLLVQQGESGREYRVTQDGNPPMGNRRRTGEVAAQHLDQNELR